jgi:hypothetical protein
LSQKSNTAEKQATYFRSCRVGRSDTNRGGRIPAALQVHQNGVWLFCIAILLLLVLQEAV